MRTSIPWLAGLLLAAWLGTAASRLSAADESTGIHPGRSEIEERLASARAELKGLPQNADPRLVDELQRLEAACEYHLSTHEELAKVRDELARSREDATSWGGIVTPPPHPVRLLDEAREELAMLENKERVSEAQIRIHKQQIDRLRDTRAAHMREARRLAETAENPRSPELPEKSRNAAKIEETMARVTAERVGIVELRIATEQARLAVIKAQKDLASRKLDEIDGQVVFTQGELDEILDRISHERDAVSAVLLRDSDNGRIPDTWMTWQLEFLDLQRSFWENRFTAMTGSDRAARGKALAALEGLGQRIDDWVKVAELRIAGGEPETMSLDPEHLRDSLLDLRAMQRRIAFAIDDLDGFSLRNRGTPVIDRAIDAFHTIWDAELYLVEESEIVDGKKIPVYRAITVGKILRLTFILVAGWLLLKWFSRSIKARIAKRASFAPATAEMVGKWAFGIGLCMLVFYGLNAVSIPLTAFAFLGGALAIGVGFGTQTILKNFISGIILLFERPLKVGDVVEVSNITGRIRKIGMRASVIQHFDGIETLVPNSILLENQLTNWTFSSAVIRHQIAVGVAYGSPTREVSRVLLAAAAGHGLVKKDPEPEVRFDDFGPDSLNFTLLFWLDASKIARAQLASDLRYMIDKAMAEAGIVIAFPQRDVHLETITPLQVQMVPGTPDNPS